MHSAAAMRLRTYRKGDQIRSRSHTREWEGSDLGFFKGLFGRKRPSSPGAEQVRIMNETYDRVVQFLGVEIFRRSTLLASQLVAESPGEMSDAVAAHIKLFATGEGANEKSVSSSTPEQREWARRIATEILDGPGSGLYIDGDLGSYGSRIEALPEDAQSIKRLALAYDHAAIILCMGVATTIVEDSPMPIVDRDYLVERALPLLEHALQYDPESSHLHATAAQFYFTLNRLQDGLVHAERSLSLDPGNAEAWRLIGNAHMVAGRDDEARAAFERALEIAPQIDGVRQALALLK